MGRCRVANTFPLQEHNKDINCVKDTGDHAEHLSSNRIFIYHCEEKELKNLTRLDDNL